MARTNTYAKRSNFVKLISIVLMLLIALSCATACEEVRDVIEDPVRQLDPPAALRVENGKLCWNPVENATKYLVSIDGYEYYSDENYYSLASVKNGEHIFMVKAIGDAVLYKSSYFSTEFKTSIYNGESAIGGYYSQFDDLTKNESFLGYGFDAIVVIISNMDHCIIGRTTQTMAEVHTETVHLIFL